MQEGCEFLPCVDVSPDIVPHEQYVVIQNAERQFVS